MGNTLPCPHLSALLRLLLGLETKELISGTVREPLGSYTAFRLYCHVFSIPSPEYTAFKGKKQMNCGAILSYPFLPDGSVTQTHSRAHLCQALEDLCKVTVKCKWECKKTQEEQDRANNG